MLISKSTKVIPNPEVERKAQATLVHVTNGWMPAHQESLQKIHALLGREDLDEHRTELAAAIKADLALLAHFARAARGQLGEPVATIHPIHSLEEIDTETLRSIFSIGAEQLSRHKIRACTRVKSELLRSALVASSAAERIASGAVESDLLIDPETAYAGASFRQLGWNLVAWNYPDLVSSALRMSSGDKAKASTYLKKLLGYSPEQLSEQLAHGFLLQPDLRDAVALSTPGKILPMANTAARLLSTVCEVGESYSRVSSERATAQDERDWESRSKELKIIAPELSVERLRKDVDERVGETVERWKSLASQGRMQQRIVSAAKEAPKRTFDSNRYLQRCPETIQEQFRPVYEEISPAGPSVDALQSLVGKAIPAAGFSGGCIFLLNDRQTDLVPAVRLGNVAAQHDKKLFSLLETSALEAFNSEVPVRKQEVTDDGAVLEHVCAAFGGAERPGVLILEVAREISGHPDFDSTLYFKAVRQCLHDCLAVNG